MATQRLKPVLKWPGGKRHMADLLLDLLPERKGRLYEPFSGGAALFFAMQPREAVLGDLNSDLINFYIQLRDRPSELAEQVDALENSEKAYYKVRGQVPACDLEKAARFLYLTTLAFNGIYRVNLRGEFNVPYGYKEHLRPSAVIGQAGLAELLASATFRVGDFETTTADAGKGDIVFMDPPYTLAHNNNGFVKYNEKIFSWDDQIRLAEHAMVLRKRGAFVVIANAGHSTVKQLYTDFESKSISRPSVIAASAEHRRKFEECVFVGAPLD